MEPIDQINSEGRVNSFKKSLVHIEQEEGWALESISAIWRRQRSIDNTRKRKNDILMYSVFGDYIILITVNVVFFKPITQHSGSMLYSRHRFGCDCSAVQGNLHEEQSILSAVSRTVLGDFLQTRAQYSTPTPYKSCKLFCDRTV